MKVTIKKILIAFTCALPIVGILIGLNFLLEFVELRDFAKTWHRIKPLNFVALICFYGIAPSLVGIVVTELKKEKQAKYYIISAVLCVMILLISLYTWIEFIDPFLESRKPAPPNDFSYITAHPPFPPISTERTLLTIGLYGSVINMTHSLLYWFFAVKTEPK